MRKIVIIIALLPLLAFSQKNFIDQPFIEVTGTFEKLVTPDKIYIGISINEADKRNQTVEEQEEILIEKICELGIDADENLFVKDFSGNYRKVIFRSNDVQKIKNYELLINNTGIIPELFKTLDDLEISNVSIIRTDHSQFDKFLLESKIEAVKIAKLKASNYAAAIDQSIGKAIYLSESNQSANYNSNEFDNVVVTGYSSKSRASYQNLKISKIKITATVLARFELK